MKDTVVNVGERGLRNASANDGTTGKARKHAGAGTTEEILEGLILRTRLTWLLQHYERRPVLALFVFINGCISIGVLAALAIFTQSPLIFPSLGPTAFLFFYTPRAPSASPRNTLMGQSIALAVGYFSLAVTGLLGTGIAHAATLQRVCATALALGLTAGLMVLFNVAHPPAAATTLIVALGITTHPMQLVAILIAVALLALQALAINRLAGVDFPLWSLSPDAKPQGMAEDRAA